MDRKISFMYKKIEQQNSMWDLDRQILTVGENYEKIILCGTWIDILGLTVKNMKRIHLLKLVAYPHIHHTL